jgi:hypothetical protein
LQGTHQRDLQTTHNVMMTACRFAGEKLVDFVGNWLEVAARSR